MLRFTKKERRSLLIMAWAIIALLAIRFWLSVHEVPLTVHPSNSSAETVDAPKGGSADRRQIPASRKPAHHGEQEDPRQATDSPEDIYARRGDELKPEVFDPNTASFEVMAAAGLPRRVVHTILNYREKGGKFYKKEDLLKIYVMTDSIYARVEQWVDIPPPPKSPARERPRVLIDINAAGPEEWTWLPGIGKGYAGRICRFRDALHGFVSIDQVGETFGLPDTVFQRIRPMITLDTRAEGIAINAWTAEELAGHPYIRPKEARILTNYRMQHGPYRQPEDVRAAMAIPDTHRLQLLVPYWRFGEEER